MLSKRFKRTASLTMAVAMVLSLIGCGASNQGTNTAKPGTSTTVAEVGDTPVEVVTEMDPNGTYFKTEYFDFALNNQNPEFYNMKQAGEDKICFTAWDKDYTKSAVILYDLKNNTYKIVAECESNYADPLSASTNIDAFTADAEGNVYLYVTGSQLDVANIPPEQIDYSKYTKDDVIKLMVGWGDTVTSAEKSIEQGEKEGWYDSYKNENGEIDWGRYYVSNISYQLPRIEYKKLQKYDSKGELLYEISDFNINGDVDPNEGNSYISSMTATSDGRLVFAVETYFWGRDIMPLASSDAVTTDVGFTNNEERKFIIVNKDGVVEKEIEWDSASYINGVYTLNDDSIALSYYDNEINDGMGGYVMAVLDIDKGTHDKKLEIPFEYFDKFVGLSGDDYLVSYNSKMYKVNLATGEKSEYINWLDCDINGQNVTAVVPVSDGRLFTAISFYDYAKQESGLSSCYLSEIPFSEVPKREYINLVCTYTDDMMAQYVINYNKTSDKYRIRITPFEYDYNSEVEYTDQLNSFMTAMASDTSIDIIVSDGGSIYSTLSNLSRKGLLIDLSEYMTSAVKKDDLIPSVLGAFSQGEKIFALPISVYPETLAGRADLVGTKTNWTIDEALEAIKKRSSGTQIMAWQDRSGILYNMISLNYRNFIDENNKCHFDNGELEKIFELCKEFPEQIDYENYTDEMQLLQEKKLMLISTSLNDMSQLQFYERAVNSPFTFVGYPSSDGNGTLLSFGNLMAITKNCKAPEEAWKFMEQYFTGEAGAYNYYGGYPVVKKQFDTVMEQRMNENYYGSYGINDVVVNIEAPSKEEVELIKNMIYDGKGIANAVPEDVMAIILEEAGAYFADQKAADEVVNIIQSRVSIKLSEQE